MDCSYKSRRIWGLGLLTLGIVFYGVHVYDRIALNTIRPNLYYRDPDDLQRLPTPEAVNVNPLKQKVTDVSSKESSNSNRKTTVLLLTYMRGGSTLLGEMLNQNPRATFWFEPMDGIYNNLYGSFSGWIPLDLLYTQEGQPRKIPDFEESAIFHQFNNLMTCNIDEIPTAILGHFAMTHIKQKRFKEYSKCLTDINKEGPIAPWYCQSKVRNVCPRYFSRNDSFITNCYYCLHVPETSPFHRTESHLKDLSKLATTFNRRCKLIKEPMGAYSQCIVHYREKMEQCLPIIKSVCDNSTIVGAKTIRLGADLAAKLLDKHPDLKVVYQSRDPRGVVHSRHRTGLLSRLSGKNLTGEARGLCSRIRRELAVVERMELLYPSRVLQVRYEDLVLDPVKAAHEFYRFLGHELPSAVARSLQTSIHSEEQGNAFNTVRRNGTDSIYRWRTGLNSRDRRAMSEVCSDVLKFFDYPES